MSRAEVETAAVTERLNKLERQNRRLRAGVLAMALAVSAVFLTASLPLPWTVRTVRAQKFVLVDAGGKTRAVLTSGKNGNPSFSLYDAKERPRATLALKSFRLFDANGKVRVTLSSSGEWWFAPHLILSGDKGTSRLGLYGPGGDAGSEIDLSDASGVERASLSLGGWRGAHPRLTFWNAKDIETASFGTASQGHYTPGLAFYSPTLVGGSIRLTMADGIPGLSLLAAGSGIDLGVVNGAPSIDLSDAKDNSELVLGRTAFSTWPYVMGKDGKYHKVPSRVVATTPSGSITLFGKTLKVIKRWPQ